MEQVLAVVLWSIVAAAWWGLAGAFLAGIRGLRRLPAAPADAVLPPVSVVVPVRDERARVEAMVAGLLAQEGVDLEVVVVDDRSTDGSRELLDALAARHPGLIVRHVDALPAGWLGKCHACHVGAQAVRPASRWLLFCDADTVLHPRAVADALAAGIGEDVAHVTLLPALARIRAAGQGLVLMGTLSIVLTALRMGRNDPRAYFAVGAFTLLRRDAYEAVGGHEALRLEVLDDVRMGLLLRRAGYPSRLYSGQHRAEVEWVTTLGSYLTVLEKNVPALFRFSLLRCFVPTTGILAAWLVAVAGPWPGVAMAGVGPALAATTGLFALALPAARLAGLYGWRWRVALLAPLLVPVAVWTAWRATVLAWRRGGVSWRGTFHGIDELRAGSVVARGR